MAALGNAPFDVHSRRLGLGEIFDMASRIFQERWGAILAITAAIDLPIAFAQGLVLHAEAPGIGANLLSGALGLIGMISVAAMIRLTADRVTTGDAAAWGALVVAGCATWPRLVLTGLLSGLLVLLWLLLLIVPGVIRGIGYAFMAWVVVLRGGRGKPALDYSRRIVRGQWWRTLGAFVGLALPILTLSLILLLPLSLFDTNLAARTLLQFPLMVASAYYTICGTVLFLNREARSPLPPPTHGSGPVDPSEHSTVGPSNVAPPANDFE